MLGLLRETEKRLKQLRKDDNESEADKLWQDEILKKEKNMDICKDTNGKSTGRTAWDQMNSVEKNWTYDTVNWLWDYAPRTSLEIIWFQFQEEQARNIIHPPAFHILFWEVVNNMTINKPTLSF